MKIVTCLFFALQLIAAPLPGTAQPASAVLTNSPETVKPLDPAAATRAWLDTIPAEKRVKSDAYFEGGYWLILWNFLLGAAISLFLLGSGLSARLRDFVERTTRFRWLRPALYAVPYVLIVSALSFPLAVYAEYFREHAYGLSTQTFGPWFREQLIGLAILLVVAAIMLAALYAVFRRAPRTWWIWGTGVAILSLFSP